MQEDAPILLDDLRTRELGDQMGTQPTNVAEHIRHQRGDLARGFAEADVIVEREFTTSTVHQGYIEPQNATALWNGDGQITVWTSTQGALSVRGQLAELLLLPVSRIKVIPMEIGGGFGGKITVYLEPLAAVLSRKAGHKPVKLVMNRAEVLMATGPTSGSYIRVKMGAKRDGRITAAEAWMAYEAGAYPGSPVGSGMNVILSPYRIENLQIDGYDVVVNKPRAAAYRAPGGTNAAFAAEAVIDELAEKVGHRPAGVSPAERRQGRGSARRRAGFPPHRLPGNGAGDPGERALPHAADRPESRPRRRLRLLGQLGRQIERLGQRERGRHGEPGGRLHRYRRQPHQHRDAVGRDARHLGAGRQAQRGRHRLGGLQRRDRRQPHHLRHRLGGLRAGLEAEGRDDPARGGAVGGRAGAGVVRRRRFRAPTAADSPSKRLRPN